MLNKNLAMALGALTGLVGLIGMIRLASGAFTEGMSALAWGAILAAMLPWIAYAAWRGRHGHLSKRGALAVVLMDLFGCAVVWLFVLGPVVALACSLAAFTVIWVSDWPPRRPSAEWFVRIEELHTGDTDQRRSPA
jgi:hypothetical protein